MANEYLLDGLDDLMRKMAAAKDIPIGKVVRNAARDYVHAAYLTTPRANRSKTAFLIVPGRGRLSGRNIWVNKLAPRKTVQSNPSVFPSVIPKGHRRRANLSPPYECGAGYAKASWVGLMRALGMNGGGGGRAFPFAANYAKLDFIAENGGAVVELKNALWYIMRLDRRAGIAHAGIALAEGRISRELARMGMNALARGITE